MRIIYTRTGISNVC